MRRSTIIYKPKLSFYGHQKRRVKELPEKEYARKAALERQSIVEYFKSHQSYGSEEWYDSDKVIKARNRRTAIQGSMVASQAPAYRCSKCKKAWQYTGLYKTQVEEVEYLAPSVWKSIPLSEKICWVCDNG